jgi:hypothetical protein
MERLPARTEQYLRTLAMRIDHPWKSLPSLSLVLEESFDIRHLTERQVLGDKDHAASGTSKKVDGKRAPEIANVDFPDFKGQLALSAQPYGFRGCGIFFGHGLASSMISILWL